VRALKDEGLIRAFGISINRWQPTNVVKALATDLVDAVQVVYNVFDQAPEDELFPECRRRNIDAVFVVGDPRYYSRFGFVAASDFGVKCEFEVPDEAFRVIELRRGTVSGGLLKYPAAFHILQ